MCISELTIDLMLDLPTQVPANIYSSLMPKASIETDVVSLTEFVASELSAPAPLTHVIAA